MPIAPAKRPRNPIYLGGSPKWAQGYFGGKTKKGKENKPIEPKEDPLNPKQRACWLRAHRHMSRTKGRLTWRHIQRLYYGQKRKCYYCQQPFKGGSIPSEAYFHIEHKKPIHQGGTNNPGNVVLACPPCNKEKWLADAPTYIATRRRRNLPTLTREQQFTALDLPERMAEAREREAKLKEKQARRGSVVGPQSSWLRKHRTPTRVR